MSGGKYCLGDQSAVPSEEDLVWYENLEQEEAKLLPSPKKIRGAGSFSSSSALIITGGSQGGEADTGLVEAASPDPYLSQSVSSTNADVQLELARTLLRTTSDATKHTEKLPSWVNYQLSCSALSDVKALIDTYDEVTKVVLPHSQQEEVVAAGAIQRGEVEIYAQSSIKDMQPILDEELTRHDELREQLQASERKLGYLQYRRKELAKTQVKGWLVEYVQQMREREEACKMEMDMAEEEEATTQPQPQSGPVPLPLSLPQPEAPSNSSDQI